MSKIKSTIAEQWECVIVVQLSKSQSLLRLKKISMRYI
jgi:hypothetical protein